MLTALVYLGLLFGALVMAAMLFIGLSKIELI
jgi:hypothetical protein